jgi:hypothetical protein
MVICPAAFLVDRPARISRVRGSLAFAWTSKDLGIGFALKECGPIMAS